MTNTTTTTTTTTTSLLFAHNIEQADML